MNDYTGKTAITFGVFDLLHFGHFELFRRIRELVGPTGKVYVMLQVDEMIEKYKPGCKNVYDFTTRQKMIETLRTVDKAIPYDVVGVDAVKNMDFNILVVGPEHTNERFQCLFKWCAENGKEVVTLQRTEGMSTTRLKSILERMKPEQKDFNLRPIWDACIDIYREVARVCDNYKLRYYATDGTAIGAVRHNGFIPWDDDFDISMPRPDYEKFKQIAARELPKYLRFWDFRDEEKFAYLFGKVQDTRAESVRNIEKLVGFTLSNGVFIDIFPIDGYPESKAEIIWVKITTGIAKCILRFRCNNFSDQSRKGKIVWLAGLVFRLLLPWATQRRCLDYCERWLLKHGFDNSAFNGRTCSSTNLFRRAPLRREAWGRPTPHEFYGTQIMLPEDADAHLRNEYYKWDYMSLPPESARHPSHGYAYRCPWWLGPTEGATIA